LPHIDVFAHNGSGVAWQDTNEQPETVVDHKRGPHQQLRLCLWLGGMFGRA
jgi:hypothetical protein